MEKDGAAIPGTDGWLRQVTVERVAPGNLQQVVGTDQGFKRITVTVCRNGVRIISLVGVRARGRDKLQE